MSIQCVFASAWQRNRLSAGAAERRPNCDHLAGMDGCDLRNLPMYMRRISINQPDIARQPSATLIHDTHC